MNETCVAGNFRQLRWFSLKLFFNTHKNRNVLKSKEVDTTYHSFKTKLYKEGIVLLQWISNERSWYMQYVILKCIIKVAKSQLEISTVSAFSGRYTVSERDWKPILSCILIWDANLGWTFNMVKSVNVLIAIAQAVNAGIFCTRQKRWWIKKHDQSQAFVKEY